MNKPLSLSIVIPAYNEAVYLKPCLDAIAIQVVPPDEVIVVDNNSSDQTRRVAEAYPFVQVIAEARQGIMYARDAGFNAAKSDIIGRIDADTVLPPGWVANVKHFYQDEKHHRSVLSGGAYFYNLRWPMTVSLAQHVIALSLNRLIMGHHVVWGSNMALPRHVWENVRPSVCHQDDIHEDLDLAVHLHQAKYPIIYRRSLRVGVEMRRIHTNRQQLWPNLMWWPRTLRVHGYKTWIIAWLGALTLYCLVPFALFVERLAQLIGLPHTPEKILKRL